MAGNLRPAGGWDSRRMADLTLRTARPEDVPGLLSLWSVAAENTNRPVDTPRAAELLIERDPAALIVAESSGTLIGSVIAGWDGWRAHLYRLAVHPAHRRQGVALALLGRAEERLVTLGATRIDAMVLDENALGRAIWQRSGYRPQPDWSRWVKPVSAGERR